MFALRDIFVIVVVFGALPAIFRTPYFGILMWSWLAYMNPHKLSWGFAQEFPFSMVVALVTLAAILNPKVEKRIPWTRESIVLLIFVGWMFITTIFAFYPGLAWNQWDKVWKIQLFTFLTMMLITDRRKVELLLWVIVFSIGLYGVKGGIFTLMTGGGYAVYGPMGTFIGGNNEIGLALIMIVPWMRYFQLTTEKTWIRMALWFSIVTTTFAILGTQSRGALVGISAMFLLLFAKNLKKIFFVFAVGGVFFLAIQFMPQTWHDRMDTIDTYEVDKSAMGRINAWWTAYYVALSNPLTGGGFEALQPPTFRLYAPNPGDPHDAHSIYFEVLGEHGFAGLTLFLLLGFFSLRSSRRIMRLTKKVEHLNWMYHLGSMMQVSLVGYAVTGVFLGLAYFDLYYALVAIVVITSDLLRQELEKEQEQIPKRRRVKPGSSPLSRGVETPARRTVHR